VIGLQKRVLAKKKEEKTYIPKVCKQEDEPAHGAEAAVNRDAE
jgi:hypothetical protein